MATPSTPQPRPTVVAMRMSQWQKSYVGPHSYDGALTTGMCHSLYQSGIHLYGASARGTADAYDPEQEKPAMYSNSSALKLDRAFVRRGLSILIGCAVAFLAFSPAGQAQGPSGYPNKPIRLLVPYGAGGVGDQTMRLLANKLSQQVKQQIVIENRPSGGGIISMSEALRSATDGYT